MGWEEGTHFADMFLNPLKYLPLVLEPIIETALGLYLRAGKESIWPNTIIKIHHNHSHSGCFYYTSGIICAGVVIESTPLNEDVNRKLRGIVSSI